MRRIIAAAREGKSILDFPVYDGSETGEKLYNTLTVIGKAIAPGDKPPDDAGAKLPALAKLTRWPVTISYFEQQDDKTRADRRADAGLYDFLRALRERHFARAAACLCRLHHQRRDDVAGAEERKAVP